jgi:hypothetical protein
MARVAVLVVTVSACASATAPPHAAPTAAPPPVTPAADIGPCGLPGPLDAIAIYRQLERHSWAGYDRSQRVPDERFGTCTVARSQIRASDGALVAELGCGVRVVAPGIRDTLGIEIGALGADVLARAPVGRPLFCVGNGPGQIRCGLERAAADDDVDPSTYVVPGDLDDEVVRGDAAARFFAPRTVVELHANVWCH